MIGRTETYKEYDMVTYSEVTAVSSSKLAKICKVTCALCSQNFTTKGNCYTHCLKKHPKLNATDLSEDSGSEPEHNAADAEHQKKLGDEVEAEHLRQIEEQQRINAAKDAEQAEQQRINAAKEAEEAEKKRIYAAREAEAAAEMQRIYAAREKEQIKRMQKMMLLEQSEKLEAERIANLAIIESELVVVDVGLQLEQDEKLRKKQIQDNEWQKKCNDVTEGLARKQQIHKMSRAFSGHTVVKRADGSLILVME